MKAQGARLPRCSAHAFAKQAVSHVPDELKAALGPLLDVISTLSEQIRAYDRAVEQLAQERYTQTALLRQVDGVGALTAVAFVLTLGDAKRFRRSRDVGPYLGLVPRQYDSGTQQSQLAISKAGNPYIRRLLVQSAHYVLGPFAEDSTLRRYGERLAQRGGKNAKKRAVVAVSRKLAVLLHHLWATGAAYEALYQQAPAMLQPAQ